jgi:N-ethylmaleimide reductase
MPALTCSRSEHPGDIPGALMRQYYTQRASKGGFIVSEGTTISPSAKGWFGAPGIYTDEQVAGWREITAAIRAKGASIFSQLLHTGRASHIDTSGYTPVTSSVEPNYTRDETIMVSTPHGSAHPSENRALEGRLWWVNGKPIALPPGGRWRARRRLGWQPCRCAHRVQWQMERNV